jgi:uncharacterized membrane protein (UPF0136 family)
MVFGQVVLLLYAIVMVAGGLAGARAGSRVSVIAGSASGLALLVALLVSLFAPPLGFWLGAAIALVLCGVFGTRLAQTRKMMPAGMLLALSALALLLLVLASRWAASAASEEELVPAVDPMPASAVAASPANDPT